MPDSLSAANFMAIGDTVPTIDPLWGEGIHKCMESARAAAVTADRCLMGSETDTSAESMAIYDDLWHARVAPDMRTRLTMTQLLYLAPNERYDRLMNDLNAMDVETLSDANDGSLRSLAKLTHLDDVPLLARFAKQRLAG